MNDYETLNHTTWECKARARSIWPARTESESRISWGNTSGLADIS